jgi:DNA-binding NtrC family response regulator
MVPSGTIRRVGRVLIVDDELLLAQSLRRILADDFEVTVTAAPTMALAWLTSGDHWYDVILCDVMMPGMHGVELHDRVSRVVPELAARFIFMTGGILVPEVQALLDRTPCIVIAKPFDYGALRELIRRRVLGDQPPRREASRA